MTFMILAAIVAGGAALVMIKRKKQSPQHPAPPAAAQPSPAETAKAELGDIMDNLLALNIMLRTDDTLTPDVPLRIETVIDDLLTVIPLMMQRYPGETLTYEMKKIGKTHLYKTVKEYLDMSAESRTQQAAVFDKTIDGLHDVARRSREIVEKNETAEFKTMANFLAGKFS